MIIALGSDHAGFDLKEKIKARLSKMKIQTWDAGAGSNEPSDYPAFIRPVAVRVGKGMFSRGLIFGGSGNGEAITANRIPGVRCAVVWSEESARLARAHNDANIISFGARMMDEKTAFAILDRFLSTPFEGGRHLRRIEQIDEGLSP